MALDLTGIENVGEFYSGHYLTAVLEGDLNALFQKWRKAKDEEGKRPPNEALASLANRYFATFGKAEGERDAPERLRLAQDFHAYLLEALGYQRAPGVEPLTGDEVVPVHLALRRDGNPFLWVLDAPFPEKADDDVLGSPPLPEQIPADAIGARLPASPDRRAEPATWREILDDRLFRIERPPRWVLFLAGTEALLIERTKWPQGKYLRFALGELFGRKQATALRAMAGLLHRDVLAPDAGLCLHDTLDENSHKHAYAVSGDLKHGVRRAVELLGNEAVWYRREIQKQGVFNDEAFAAKLTSESLTWLYRLLFLFYVEARGSDLGAVPMRSDAYRKGYSLESLRDLELVPLTTDHARNGFFLHDSLKTLFRILNLGFPQLELGAQQTDVMRELATGDMWVDALQSPLFDDERLELLKGVRFRNFVLQEVLQLLSLSGQKRRQARGRISYAQLGINQLGAVYEGLLSYSGFFATEDLYEVASKDDCEKLSGKPAAEREALKTYFVPASRIGDYEEAEIVRDEANRKVVHRKGTFIFRLAGRNREKSASYYTPEVLTRCLVKYALKELLYDEDGKSKKTADKILALTICEPAMGSASFLIEAVDQLADAYLTARQEELGQTIPPEDYQREKRRVKARLATNNCYGVDLNPTAVELAKVSLWLATLHEGGKCPWFGLRLATGNSLVGARREVFKTADVIRKGTKDNPNWLGLAPEPAPLYHGPDGPPLDEHWTPPKRPAGTIYHFLLPAEGMAAFDTDKVVKELAPDDVARIKAWRKEFCKPFTKEDAKRLEKLSDAVDRLFAQVVRERVLATTETSDRIPVWGEPARVSQPDLLVRDQEEVAAALESNSSAYRRLEVAMDAWCALWFWPIEKSQLLPDRATWLAWMELLLVGRVIETRTWSQQDLFSTSLSSPTPQTDQNEERRHRLRTLSERFLERRSHYLHECGLADIDTLIEQDPGLVTAEATADRLHFHHWHLRFSDVFASSGGFDLQLGNPPWVRLAWDELAVLGDSQPQLSLRRVDQTRRDLVRDRLLEDNTFRRLYLEEFTAMQGGQRFLNSTENYAPLQGVKVNLYKCFIHKTWTHANPSGTIGLIHPRELFDDRSGAEFRKLLYPRLRMHFQFRNALGLFDTNDHGVLRFGLNIYGPNRPGALRFLCCSNLVHPSTLDASFAHDGRGQVPRIRNDEDDWDLSGHSRRILAIDQAALELFAELYGDPKSDPLTATLPSLHSEEILSALRRFRQARYRLGENPAALQSTYMWDETKAQRDGLIQRRTGFPKTIDQWVIQGPHFYVGNPLNKTPRESCESRGAYSDIDLASIPDNYLPRSNYAVTAAGAVSSRSATFRDQPMQELFRLGIRKRMVPSNERSLIAAIIPKGAPHIYTCLAVAMPYRDLALCACLLQSIPLDFFVKVTGKMDFQADLLAQLPRFDHDDLESYALARVLRLNCISSWYIDLWRDLYSSAFRSDLFTQVDPRFAAFTTLTAEWSSHCGVRSDLERRQALIESDVIAAMALGIDLGELITIYRVQFPVLQKYEAELVYDQQGRTVATSKSAAGFPGANLVELAASLRVQAGFDIHAEYHPDASNTRDLQRQNLRLGAKEAEVLGVPECCTMADLLAETDVRWSDAEHPEGRPVRLVGLRYTDPGLEPRMERVYPTPWTRCDREADYRQAWAEFERRLGKKMPEGTPL